jgi:glycosyltransferase involved in cell wall biosynthesis
VRKVLHLIPDFDYCGAGKQLVLLAKHLPRARFEIRVCALGPPGPLLDDLHAAGVSAEALNWHRLVDIRPYLRIRGLLKEFRPHLIHAWKAPAWRLASLAAPSWPLLATALNLKNGNRAGVAGLDRWLARRSTRFVAANASEAHYCMAEGVPPHALLPVTLAVESAAPNGQSHSSVRDGLRLPAAARVILCVGPLEAKKGFVDAIWAFDILKYLYRDLHLVIVGDGPDRRRLEQFVRSDQARIGVHFVGKTNDIGPFFELAEVVWVPSRIERGVNVALEAMAAGRPVVASRLPALQAVVADGETGLIFPPGDKVALARQTRQLLDNQDRRERLGKAGQERAAVCCSVQSFIRAYTELYEAAVKDADVK